MSIIKKSSVIHPFLFAVFPIFFMFSYNVEFMELSELVTPLMVSIIPTFLLWQLLSFLLKDKKKAGLIVSFFIIIFFSYGHIYNELQYIRIWNIKIVKSKYLLTANGLLLSLAIYFILRVRNSFSDFTYILNVISSLLVIISITSIFYGISTREDVFSKDQVESSISGEVLNGPDIYYIILDQYGREDVLKQMYNYDNAPFLNYLKQKGFYIANNGSCNYCSTKLSLSSSLNMMYLDGIAKQVGENSMDFRPLKNLISNNKVVNFLKKKGYSYYSYSSGYSFTEVTNSDVYLTKPGLLSEFHNILISTTIIPVLLKKIVNQYDLHRERLIFIFNSLIQIAKDKSPKFVFAHIISPHPPFVFGKNGEPIKSDRPFFFRRDKNLMNKADAEDYIEKYKNQLIYLNRKMIEVIDLIIANSAAPPIILLQADHGPAAYYDRKSLKNSNLKERMSILNAYYFPKKEYNKLYNSISPVNSFRIIFNQYFNTNYTLLKDKNYFSSCISSYKFINVTPDIN